MGTVGLAAAADLSCSAADGPLCVAMRFKRLHFLWDVSARGPSSVALAAPTPTPTPNGPRNS
eukprot:scaffold58489_cov36-Phaeocystis_antarctica.AAC.1